jgi:hypothetical protein
MASSADSSKPCRSRKSGVVCIKGVVVVSKRPKRPRLAVTAEGLGIAVTKCEELTNRHANHGFPSRTGTVRVNRLSLDLP